MGNKIYKTSSKTQFICNAFLVTLNDFRSFFRYWPNHAWGKGRSSYRSAGLVVVQVHLLAEWAPPLARVHELPGELEAVVDVVGAAAPLPVGGGRGGASLATPRVVAVVAGASRHAALATRPCDRVCDPRRRDRVDERRLAAAWNRHGTWFSVFTPSLDGDNRPLQTRQHRHSEVEKDPYNNHHQENWGCHRRCQRNQEETEILWSSMIFPDKKTCTESPSVFLFSSNASLRLLSKESLRVCSCKNDWRLWHHNSSSSPLPVSPRPRPSPGRTWREGRDSKSHLRRIVSTSPPWQSATSSTSLPFHGKWCLSHPTHSSHKSSKQGR